MSFLNRLTPLRCVCIGLLLFVSSAAATAPSWLLDHATSVQRKAMQHNIPGYVFVYVEKGRPAHVVTYGKTARSGEAITEDTVFRLASVSKTFTAMLMAKLVDKTALDWQTPVATLAPEFGFSNATAGGINLTHLIGQSSGYMPNAYDNLIDANYPLRRVLNMLADLEPLCQPGKCYTYQNTLFGVLEHYFEQQNSSYAETLKRELLNPLGMPHASTGKAALEASEQWAKPHIAITRKKWRKSTVRDNYYKFSPAAGVNASIRDMSIWIRAMLGEYPHLIDQQDIDKLTTPVVKTRRELNRRSWRSHLNDAHYGLGWRIYDFEGYKLNYHGGWVMGYRADVSFAPELGVGYAMLMNAESNLINSFTAEFWDSFFKVAKQTANNDKLANKFGD